MQPPLGERQALAKLASLDGDCDHPNLVSMLHQWLSCSMELFKTCAAACVMADVADSLLRRLDALYALSLLTSL